MNNNDRWFFGFVALWIILCAGEPDLLDAIVVRVALQDCGIRQVLEEK